MSKIHDRIKERREAVGLTLAQLAEITGVKEATAQRWESGNIKTIKYETIEVLADALKCTPQYLMGWEDKIDPTNASDGEVENVVSRLYDNLPPEKKAAALEYLRFLSQSQDT